MSDPRHDEDDAGGARSYVMVVLIGLVIGAGLLLFVAGYRDEIVAILSQSPT